MCPTHVNIVQRMLTLRTLAIVFCAARLGAQSAPTEPAPGRLITVGSHKMHIRCVGPESNGPTVILEAGGGGSSKSWTKVLAVLPQGLRACAYDRAGQAWSEPGPAPRTFHQEVFELHELLAAAKITGPYVLVGQSIGGVNARLYAEQYDRDVAGMVLVDATHEEDVNYSMRVNNWVRMRDLSAGRSVPAPKLEGKVSTQYDPAEDYMAEEFEQLHRAREAKPAPLGDRPLVVLAAGKRPTPPGTADSLWTRLRKLKDEQQQELARLSRNSRFTVDPTSAHNMQDDDPALVARAIEDVVRAASTKGRLAP